MKSASHPITAAFDTTRPTHTRFGIDILSVIQPVAVSRALHAVYARLADGVRVFRNSHEHVVSVGGVISNATSYVTAMVGGSVPGISPGTARFVVHYVVVTRAKRSQVAAQNICWSSGHKNPLKRIKCPAILGGSLYGSEHCEAEHNYNVIEPKAVLCSMGQFKGLSRAATYCASWGSSTVVSNEKGVGEIACPLVLICLRFGLFSGPLPQMQGLAFPHSP